MCGRYTQTLKADDLVAAMSAADETGGMVSESYNVAPTETMPVVVAGTPPEPEPEPAPDADPGTGTAAGPPPEAGGTLGGASRPGSADNGPRRAVEPSRRALRLARWGLVPPWAKDVSIGSRLINARAETVAAKPAFRSAYLNRRCLVPATGYYEWHKPAGSSGRGQPYFIHPASGGLLAFAGLYEVWLGGPTPLVSYTILTTASAGGLEFLHDRSPVLVPHSAWDRWLGPGPAAAERDRSDPSALAELLRPAPPGLLTAYPVGREVGNVRNRGPRLLDPVELPGPADGRPLRPTAVDLTLFDV